MGDKTGGRGQAFEVCVTAQSDDLDAAEFGALTYVPVCCLQETPELSSAANIVSENCISGERIRMAGADEDSGILSRDDGPCVALCVWGR